MLTQAYPLFRLLECKASGTSWWVKRENREIGKLASESAQKEESAWFPSHPSPRGWSHGELCHLGSGPIGNSPMGQQWRGTCVAAE